MIQPYHPVELEEEVQAYWDNNQSNSVKEDLNREKFYSLAMLPYPSGELHMGHVRNYTLTDIISRYQHMKGKNVLQPMGWDSFGLPAENAAIAHQVAPAEWVNKNIKRMRKQLQQLGFAIDWNREISTSDPEYYHWEQWLFVRLLKKGLIYNKESVVNWDPVDKTVLANEQVVDGKGWRSGAPVERKLIPQWFLKITDYTEELLQDLDQLTGWPEQVVTMQRNWIGRSEGTTVKFRIFKTRNQFLDVFTTRADTLMGTTYLCIAQEHPLVEKWAQTNNDIKKYLKSIATTKVDEATLATQEKSGVFTGQYAVHPITKEKLPIWVANFVLMEYGSGAVMSVPAHDPRDFEFAKLYDLPIKPVIKPIHGQDWDFNEAAFTEEGTLIHSQQFNDLASAKARDMVATFLDKQSLGGPCVKYRLRDWGISRQRYWGTPIPIIHCKKCGTVPVPEEDLPVKLPLDLIPDGTKSPLKTCPSFYKTKCPKCQGPAKRETDTMDTFVESSWYFYRYCCFDQNNAMLDDRAKYWTPVDQYVGGIEHAVLHLLYARFMNKILRDEGLINSDEPFTNLLTQGMVLKDGCKMSKSKGNTVSPQKLIKQYGADTVRLFITFAAPPEQDMEWSDHGVEGAFKFLKKLWNFCQSVQATIQGLNQTNDQPHTDYSSKDLQTTHREIHLILKQTNYDIERLQFNTVVSATMKLLNLLTQLNQSDHEEALLLHEGLSILLRILTPITPHICHQLWFMLEYDNNVTDASWPKVNNKALQTTEIEWIVQVNGKVRAKIIAPVDTEQEELQRIACLDENIQRHLQQNKTIKKFIIIPNKLINIVV